MLALVDCLRHDHDMRLVLLAVVLCMMSCLTTVMLLGRAASGDRRGLRQRWAVAAGMVFGAGVWSLHFVAMLGFRPDDGLTYEWMPTALSMLVICVSACLAFLLLARKSGRLWSVLAASLLCGGIVVMHQLGVGAMVNAVPRLGLRVLLVSAAAGWGACLVATLRIGPFFSGRRFEAAAWLAVAICAIHFIGMMSLHLQRVDPIHNIAHRSGLGGSGLAIAVSATSFILLFACLTAAALEQQLAQQADREARRLQRLASVAMEGLLIYQDGRIAETNDAMCRLLGLKRPDLVGRSLKDFVSAASLAPLLNRLAIEDDQLPPLEVVLRAQETRRLPVEMLAREIEFEGRRAQAVAFRDLTDRKRDEERIRHLAHHDALTDLPNRFLLRERLGHALDYAARGSTGVGVLYLDLDGFKPVNDLLGHACGDALLIQVSKRLLAELKPADTLARMGGDEFVVVQPFVDSPEQVAGLAHRLCSRIRHAFDIDGRLVELSVSLGIALYPADGATEATLLRNADTAMYRAKEDRAGGFRFFEAGMDGAVQAERQLKLDIRLALERGEITPHYQPIFGMRSNQVEGMAASLRWVHPGQGVIPDDVLVALAEESGEMIRLGRHLLQSACREAASWAVPRQISIDLSPTQLRQPELLACVEASLEASGLAPHRLELAVGDDSLGQDTGEGATILPALRQLGVRLVLDGFGRGRAGIGLLRLFEFDKIRIDGKFVTMLGIDAKADVILRAIVAMSRNLGLAIGCSGIDTEAQLDRARGLGCDVVQGDLLGPPRPHAVSALPQADETYALRQPSRLQEPAIPA